MLGYKEERKGGKGNRGRSKSRVKYKYNEDCFYNFTLRFSRGETLKMKDNRIITFMEKKCEKMRCCISYSDEYEGKYKYEQEYHTVLHLIQL